MDARKSYMNLGKLYRRDRILSFNQCVDSTGWLLHSLLVILSLYICNLHTVIISLLLIYVPRAGTLHSPMTCQLVELHEGLVNVHVPPMQEPKLASSFVMD